MTRAFYTSSWHKTRKILVGYKPDLPLGIDVFLIVFALRLNVKLGFINMASQSWKIDKSSMLLLFASRSSWWRHQMETFSALLALCKGNSSVTGEFPSQSPVLARSCNVFFDLHLSKRLSKQSRRRWFETPWCLLWHHRILTCQLSCTRVLSQSSGGNGNSAGRIVKFYQQNIFKIHPKQVHQLYMESLSGFHLYTG